VVLGDGAPGSRGGEWEEEEFAGGGAEGGREESGSVGGCGDAAEGPDVEGEPGEGERDKGGFGEEARKKG
jgi:hypothetical protein